MGIRQSAFGLTFIKEKASLIALLLMSGSLLGAVSLFLADSAPQRNFSAALWGIAIASVFMLLVGNMLAIVMPCTVRLEEGDTVWIIENGVASQANPGTYRKHEWSDKLFTFKLPIEREINFNAITCILRFTSKSEGEDATYRDSATSHSMEQMVLAFDQICRELDGFNDGPLGSRRFLERLAKRSDLPFKIDLQIL